jgi:hypothetical protein
MEKRPPLTDLLETRAQALAAEPVLAQAGSAERGGGGAQLPPPGGVRHDAFRRMAGAACLPIGLKPGESAACAQSPGGCGESAEWPPAAPPGLLEARDTGQASRRDCVIRAQRDALVPFDLEARHPVPAGPERFVLPTWDVSQQA